MYVVTSWFKYAEEVDNHFFATKRGTKIYEAKL